PARPASGATSHRPASRVHKGVPASVHVRMVLLIVLMAFATAVRATAEPKRCPPSSHPVSALSLSPDGKRLAAARGDQVPVFDIESSQRPVVTTLATPGEP